MADFLHMGGYAFYVWTSYLVVLALLLWHFLAPLNRVQSLLRIISLQSDGKDAENTGGQV